uniref:Uncharacterized protein n=1 Tax=Rhizophagus irregularis (strain DAOM 181602 / DAOM 197198 / MUCL 43194) TaxID=747089 RepID=U9TPK0_RHIID
MRVVEGRNDETYYKGQNVKLALMFSEAYLYGNNDDTNLLRVTRLIRIPLAFSLHHLDIRSHHLSWRKVLITIFLLLNTSNLIKKFTLYVNKRVKKRSSDDCDTITIENAEVDNIEVEEGSTLSLFGIEIKGKVSLSNIKFKNITIKKRKLEDN